MKKDLKQGRNLLLFFYRGEKNKDRIPLELQSLLSFSFGHLLSR